MNRNDKRSRWRTLLREARHEGRDAARFDFACALYWFCADHHDGQWSRRYSVLSRIGYRPGLSERGPESGSMAEMICDALIEADALS